MAEYKHPDRSSSWQGLGFCWIGGARYSQPLNSTVRKKWQALCSLGIEICVISFSADVHARRFKEYANFYLLPNIPIAQLRYLIYYAVVPFIALWLILRRNIQVLIAQDPYFGVAAAQAKQVARIFGRRVALIIETRGDFEEALFSYRTIHWQRIYRWLMRRMLRYSMRHADALRSISVATHNQLQRLAPHTPIVQFMSWTDADEFMLATRPVPIARSQDVVFAGTLAPVKGVHVLIDAFARVMKTFAEAHLWLVGSSDNTSYIRQINLQIDSLGLDRHVTWVGHVTQAELASIMARARVLALPSYSEGLGKVLVEAMMCGTPVIGSQVGGIPDVIQDSINGYLVPPGDIDALADRLMMVLGDQKIEEMSVRARAFATRYFSRETYLKSYSHLFALAAESIVHHHE